MEVRPGPPAPLAKFPDPRMYNYTNTGKTEDSSYKICILFYKYVHSIPAKIIIVSPASIFVGE